MRDDFAHARVEGDLQDLLIVFQIDTSGRLEPEVVTGAGFRHRFVLVTALQATHREVFDGAAAEIFQQGNRGFNRTMPSGALLLSGPVEILTIPTVPVGETRPLTTESFCPSSARLVATPVNTWLTCCGCT